MRIILTLLLMAFATPALALTYEPGADAPTRTLEDYIKDYVDVPKGATDWKVFGATKQINVEWQDKKKFSYQYFKPEFTQAVKDLDGKTVTVKGYMFPLGENEKQNLFLFGPFPVSCPFQYHVGSNLVMEVHADAAPIKFSYDAIVITGTLELVPKDEDNSTFYRLRNAHIVK